MDASKGLIGLQHSVTDSSSDKAPCSEFGANRDFSGASRSKIDLVLLEGIGQLDVRPCKGMAAMGSSDFAGEWPVVADLRHSGEGLIPS
jgi:hypothetical protein